MLLRAHWPAPSGVVAFTTLRGPQGVSHAPFQHFNLGEHCGDDPAAVAANRAQLREIAALPNEPRWLRQVHGTNVASIDDATPPPACRGRLGGGEVRSEAFGHSQGRGLEADASITATPDTVLAILTADCLPVLFCAADGSEVGAAHAGWRGLAAGVLERTVEAMRTAPHELLAWLGPAAGPLVYEIGAEVRDAFLSHDAGAATAFDPTRPGHWRIDLYALARQRLSEAGVLQIYGGGLCTISDPQRFYSHRRDGRSGRMASLIWISR